MTGMGNAAVRINYDTRLRYREREAFDLLAVRHQAIVGRRGRPPTTKTQQRMRQEGVPDAANGYVSGARGF